MRGHDVADLAELIGNLASVDVAVRDAAAGELYRRGQALGDAAVAAWRKDHHLGELLGASPTVGVAVQPETFRTIHIAAGNPHLAEVPPDQDVREFELAIGAARLDILTTRDASGGGAIARFLEEFGEGIQQVEYETPDVDRATELLRSQFELAPVYAAARPGADGTSVNFFLSRTPEGAKVLVELVEIPREK